MNRKERRAQASEERRDVKGSTPMESAVLAKLRAFDQGNDEMFDDDLDELLLEEGFDDALDAVIMPFLAKHPGFDVPALKSELLFEAASYFGEIEASPDKAPRSFECTLFALAVSGRLGDLLDGWKSGALQTDICTLIAESGVAPVESRIELLPALVEVEVAASVGPGVVARLVRRAAERILRGEAMDADMVNEDDDRLSGLVTNVGDGPIQREAIGSRLVLGIEIREIFEDSEFLDGILVQDREDSVDHWFAKAQAVLPEKILVAMPAYFDEATLHLGIFRIGSALQSELSLRGFDPEATFDTLTVAVGADLVWVTGRIGDTEFGPVDCLKLVAMIDFEAFLENLEEGAGEVVLTDVLPSVSRATH